MRKPTARDIRLLILYGITELEYDRILEHQGGGCAICGRKPSAEVRLSVDHDHHRNVTRGLLCWTCNRVVALLRDDPARARSAYAYLDAAPSLVALGFEPNARAGRSTRKWRTKREKRERMAWVAARLEALGYEVPKRLWRDTEVK